MPQLNNWMYLVIIPSFLWVMGGWWSNVHKPCHLTSPPHKTAVEPGQQCSLRPPANTSRCRVCTVRLVPGAPAINTVTDSYTTRAIEFSILFIISTCTHLCVSSLYIILFGWNIEWIIFGKSKPICKYRWRYLITYELNICVMN